MKLKKICVVAKHQVRPRLLLQIELHAQDLWIVPLTFIMLSSNSAALSCDTLRRSNALSLSALSLRLDSVIACSKSHDCVSPS